MAEEVYSDKHADKLLEIEVMVKQGDSVSQACQKAGISLSEYRRWSSDIAELAMNEAIINYSESEKLTESVMKIVDQQIRPRVYQQVVVTLLKDKKTISPDLIKIVKKFYREAKQLQEILLNSVYGKEQEKISITCEKGCDYCCRLTVVATEPELVIIREYLLDTGSEASLEVTRENLRQFCLRTCRCTTWQEKLSIKCGFLKEGSCTIYDVRPIACRAWNSTDVETCKRYLKTSEEEISASICHNAPYDVIKKGINHALHATGFIPPNEELNSGVLRLLNV